MPQRFCPFLYVLFFFSQAWAEEFVCAVSAPVAKIAFQTSAHPKALVIFAQFKDGRASTLVATDVAAQAAADEEKKRQEEEAARASKLQSQPRRQGSLSATSSRRHWRKSRSATARRSRSSGRQRLGSGSAS